MAAAVATNNPTSILAEPALATEQDSPPSPAPFIGLSSDTPLLTSPSIQAPFDAIRQIFDHLRATPDAAAALNATYPKRGILKMAATHNPTSDQKFTIDLSPTRISLIPNDVRASLSPHGLDAILTFFSAASAAYIGPILATLSAAAGADLAPYHRGGNLNWRLCDYSPDTAAPQDPNGCGAHTDYGTFSIIFQHGVSGLEIEDLEKPGEWTRVPGDATVVLAGWCALVLSGGKVRALRHRVRRVPGMRRLSAVLFVAPDLDVVLKPVEGVKPAMAFSKEVMGGEVDVEWFKEVMGKRWRWREGNEELADGEEMTQDDDIRRLIFG
ncbi:Oxoglutarate/iron-dependent oxygenase [Lasiodiplodia theobromae]|nr:Oxoglutarate/iron-dependent oxygenase [Lasiodiplodia theobromae]